MVSKDLKLDMIQDLNPKFYCNNVVPYNVTPKYEQLLLISAYLNKWYSFILSVSSYGNLFVVAVVLVGNANAISMMSLFINIWQGASEPIESKQSQMKNSMLKGKENEKSEAQVW